MFTKNAAADPVHSPNQHGKVAQTSSACASSAGHRTAVYCAVAILVGVFDEPCDADIRPAAGARLRSTAYPERQRGSERHMSHAGTIINGLVSLDDAANQINGPADVLI